MKRTSTFFALLPLAFAAVMWLAPSADAQSAPATPTLNSANAVSACAVDLNWTQSNHADSFRVNVNNSPNSFEAAGISGTGEKSFTHTQLIPGLSYTYRVQACRTIGGCSTLSSSRIATTPAVVAPPTAPSALRVAGWEANGGRVVLSWTPSAAPAYSGFRVYRSDDGGTTFTAVDTLSLEEFQSGISGSVAANTWEDSVSTDALHIYKFRTYQTAASCLSVTEATPDGDIVPGAVPPHVRFSSFSADLVVPARPASAFEAATRNNRTEAKFGWSDVAREGSYNFQLSDREDYTGIGTRDRTYPAGATETISTFEPDGFFTFAPEQTFYYRVRACTAGGAACSEFRDGAPYSSSLVGPRNLSASASPRGTTAADVLLSWNDTANYHHTTRIYRKLSTEGTFTRITTPDLSGVNCFGDPLVCEYPVTHTDENFPISDVTYDYRVTFVQVSDGTESEPSNTASVNLNLSFLDQWGWANAGGYTEPPTLNWSSVPLSTPNGNLNESCVNWLARTGQAGDSGTQPRVSSLPGGRGTIFDNRCVYYQPTFEEFIPRIPTFANAQWYPTAGEIDGAQTQVARGSTPGPTLPIGLGWVRTAWNAVHSAWGDATAGPDSEPYAVAMDATGKFSGYAWTPNGGWLSFNSTDLAGCPGGPCEARADIGTGAVTGWAKFVKWGASGWVSLSYNDALDRYDRGGEYRYGLVYDDVNKKFAGEAWGGNVTGWLAFAGLPAPTLHDPESPTLESLTLRWDNPVDYERLRIAHKASSDSNFTLRIISDPALLSQGQNRTTQVPSLSSGTSYDFYLEGTKSAETAVSNVRTGTTLGVPGGYTFICRAANATSITLSWVGDAPDAHQLQIFGGNSSTSLSLLATRASGGGFYEHEGLPENATRYYQMKVDYATSTGKTDVFVPEEPVACTTFTPIPQDPALLDVTALSPTSLYVTWKDNATRPHDFVLERIKVTPATSTNVTAARNGANVDLAWANGTNTRTFRSPYYHVVERSSEGDPQVRFTEFDTTSSSFPMAFGEDMAFTGTRASYDYTDVNVPSGTYYYRVKACSLLKVDYTGDGVLDDVCTVPTDASGSVTIAATSASRAASFLGSIKSFFGRVFGDVSAQVGTVNGAQIDLNTYFDQFRTGQGSVPALTFATNPGIYRDNGLEPDTVYLYRVKTVYTDGAGGETSYTNEGAGKTLNSGATTPQSVRVCVRNNLCGTMTGARGGGETPANQCTTNADCRNVGTTRQFFEEQ